MNLTQRTLQEYASSLSPAAVIAEAKRFFSSRASLYAAFLDTEGPAHVTFRGQGGEELVIAAVVRDGSTLVTGSSYLFDMQVARFFTTLAPAAPAERRLPPVPAEARA